MSRRARSFGTRGRHRVDGEREPESGSADDASHQVRRAMLGRTGLRRASDSDGELEVAACDPGRPAEVRGQVRALRTREDASSSGATLVGPEELLHEPVVRDHVAATVRSGPRPVAESA